MQCNCVHRGGDECVLHLWEHLVILQPLKTRHLWQHLVILQPLKTRQSLSLDFTILSFEDCPGIQIIQMKSERIIGNKIICQGKMTLFFQCRKWQHPKDKKIKMSWKQLTTRVQSKDTETNSQKDKVILCFVAGLPNEPLQSYFVCRLSLLPLLSSLYSCSSDTLKIQIFILDVNTYLKYMHTDYEFYLTQILNGSCFIKF